mgnify:FL=1
MSSNAFYETSFIQDKTQFFFFSFCRTLSIIYKRSYFFFKIIQIYLLKTYFLTSIERKINSIDTRDVIYVYNRLFLHRALPIHTKYIYNIRDRTCIYCRYFFFSGHMRILIGIS